MPIVPERAQACICQDPHENHRLWSLQDPVIWAACSEASGPVPLHLVLLLFPVIMIL